jgi:hypothetical protein
MEKELNLVLNLTNSQFDMKMIKIRDFQNPKNQIQYGPNQISIEKDNVKIRSKVIFEIKK